MEVQAGGRVIHDPPDVLELRADIDQRGAGLVIEAVLGKQRRPHVEAVQPDLPGISLLVPEIAVAGPRMGIELAAQRPQGFGVTRVPGLAVEQEQDLAGVDVVEAVFVALVTLDRPVRSDPEVDVLDQAIEEPPLAVGEEKIGEPLVEAPVLVTPPPVLITAVCFGILVEEAVDHLKRLQSRETGGRRPLGRWRFQ